MYLIFGLGFIILFLDNEETKEAQSGSVEECEAVGSELEREPRKHSLRERERERERERD